MAQVLLVAVRVQDLWAIFHSGSRIPGKSEMDEASWIITQCWSGHKEHVVALWGLIISQEVHSLAKKYGENIIKKVKILTVVIFQLNFRESMTVCSHPYKKKYLQDKSSVGIEDEFLLTALWFLAYVCLANPGHHLSNDKESWTQNSSVLFLKMVFLSFVLAYIKLLNHSTL